MTQHAESATLVATCLKAVEQAFAHCEMTLPDDACAHCTTPDYMDELRLTPVMELSDEAVFDVVASLGLTYGHASDVAHFVPRWCSDGLNGPVYEITHAFSRIAWAGYERWEPPLRNALRDFLLAQLHHVLNGPPSESSNSLRSITDIYQCLACLGYLSDFCFSWERSTSAIADRHFPELIRHISVDERGAFSYSGSWWDVAVDDLVAWLRSDGVRERLIRAVDNSRRADLIQVPLAALLS